MVAKAKIENIESVSQEIDVTLSVPASLSKFYTQTRDELDAPTTFDEALERATEYSEDLLLIGSNARVAPKDELLNRPFLIRSFRFQESKDYFGTFVIVNIVTKDTDENLIFTDGSEGVKAQLEREANRRLAAGHPTPFEGVIVPNGLRVSEYPIDAEGRSLPRGEKGVGRGRTFYIA